MNSNPTGSTIKCAILLRAVFRSLVHLAGLISQKDLINPREFESRHRLQLNWRNWYTRRPQKALPSGSEFESQIQHSMKTLTTETYDEALNGLSGHVVLDFYADWCEPCQQMSVPLAEIAEELNLNVYKVNSDTEQDIVRKHNVMGLPTLVVLKDGLELKRLVGAKSKASLLEDLADL